MNALLKRLRLFLSSAPVRRTAHAMREHGVVVPLYLAITLLFTYPTVLHFSDAIVGEGPDALQSYWTMWWTRRALLELGQNSFQATLMQHPFGLTLYFHVHNFFNSLLSLPLQLCCGTAAAYNSMVFLTFVLTGLSLYALTWHLVRQRAAAFVAGLVAAFNPYMVLHLRVGQPYLLSIGWLAFYILALLKGLRERRYWLVLAALFLLLVALTDWHYAIFAVLLTGLIGLYEVLRLRSWHALIATTGKLALVGLLFALALSPILVPMLGELSQRPSVPRPLWNAVYHSTDLLAYLLPSIYHPLWGKWASSIFYGRLVTWYIVGGIATLGYVPLLLALAGAIFERQRSRLFVLLFLVFFVLTLGPFLQVNGWNSYREGSPIPLPYLLLRQLPLMNIQRVPSRFFVVVLLALAVLVGFGVAWLWRRPPVARLPRRGQAMLLVAVAGLVLFEYWPRPFVLTPVGPEQVSPFYRQLAADPAAYAILELPYLGNTSSFNQTYHMKNTVGGIISRTPTHPWRDARLFGPLIRVEPTWRDVGSADSPAAVHSALHCQGVRYVVFYKQESHRIDDPAYLSAIEQYLFGAASPVYDDAVLRAYEVTNEQPAVPYWTLAPGGWYDAQVNEQGVVYRWAEGTQGSLLIYPCQAQAQRQAVLHFNIFSFALPRTIQVSLDGRHLADLSLPAETVRRVSLVLPLHAGENRLTLRSVEPALPPAAQGFRNDERMLSFNLSRVSIESRETGERHTGDGERGTANR